MAWRRPPPVAERLRRQPRAEKLVLAALTGYGQEDDRRRAAAAGFDHHVTKPAETRPVTRAWKTCSRGHEYRGTRCPVCWKGNRTKKRRA